MKIYENIDTIFVLKNNEERIDKIICLYSDCSTDFYELPDYYLDCNDKEKERLELKQIKILNKYIKSLPDELQKDAVVYVDMESINEYLENLIKVARENDIKDYNFDVNLNLAMSLIDNFWTKIPLLSSKSLIFMTLSIFHSLVAIKINSKIDIREKKQLIKSNFKLFVSAILIGINLKPIVEHPSYYRTQALLSNNSIHSSLLSFEQNIEHFGYTNPFTENNNLTQDEEIEYLMEALLKNDDLSEDELNVALKLKEYLKINPYIDKEKLYEKFLKISVIEQKSVILENIAAWNNLKYNVITFFDKSRFSEEEYEYYLYHEFIHSTAYIDNNCINEGMTNLLASEILGVYCEGSYPREVMICKILCELIGPDIMLEAYTTNNSEIIIEALNELYPDELENREFLKFINDCSINSQDNLSSNSFTKLDELINYLENYYEFWDEDFENPDLLQTFIDCYKMSLLNNKIDDFHIRYYNCQIESKLERKRQLT